MNNKAQFLEAYTAALAVHKEKSPDSYNWKAGDTTESVAIKMIEAFAKGSASITGTPTKNACKSLGIKPSVKAIREYLAMES